MKQSNDYGNNSAVEYREGKLYLAFGWTFALISIFFLPFVFGPLGIMMGMLANRKGMYGNIVIIFSTFFAVLGLLIGAMIIAFFHSYLGVMTTIY